MTKEASFCPCGEPQRFRQSAFQQAFQHSRILSAFCIPSSTGGITQAQQPGLPRKKLQTAKSGSKVFSTLYAGYGLRMVSHSGIPVGLLNTALLPVPRCLPAVRSPSQLLPQPETGRRLQYPPLPEYRRLQRGREIVRSLPANPSARSDD